MGVLRVGLDGVSPGAGDEGRSLEVYDEGAGTPVVLLHSSGLSARQWARLGASLARSHRVLRPELLGYGASSKVALERYDFSDDLALVRALLRSLGEPAHVIGHSFGGLLAMRASLDEPACVRSVAAYEPVCFGVLRALVDDDEVVAAMVRELDSFDRSYVRGPGGEADARWLRGFVEFWNGPGAWEALAPAIREGFLRVGDKVFGEVSTLFLDPTSLEAYARVEVGALLVSGAKSPAIERRVCEVLAGVLPKGRLVTLEDAGHMGPLTHGATVNALFEAHVAACD